MLLSPHSIVCEIFGSRWPAMQRTRAFVWKTTQSSKSIFQVKIIKWSSHVYELRFSGDSAETYRLSYANTILGKTLRQYICKPSIRSAIRLLRSLCLAILALPFYSASCISILSELSCQRHKRITDDLDQHFSSISLIAIKRYAHQADTLDEWKSVYTDRG